MEAKIQRQVLDPLLGPGRAFPFVDAQLSVRTTTHESSREGSGAAARDRGQSEDGVFGDLTLTEQDFAQGLRVQPPFNPAGDSDAPGAPAKWTLQRISQSAHQHKREAEAVSGLVLEFRRLEIVILHDASLPATQLDGVRDVLLLLYGRVLRPEDLRFMLARFQQNPPQASRR